MNLGLIFFATEVFYSIATFIPILLFTMFICIDMFIRPKAARKAQYTRPSLIGMLLLLPLFAVVPYFEYRFLLSSYLSSGISFGLLMMGILALSFGGSVLLVSRTQMGRANPRIVFENLRRLVTDGSYRYIRHPQYLGLLLLFVGYAVSFGGVITSIIVLVGLFLGFRAQMIRDEASLITLFGEDYIQYQQRTRRLIPYVY